ncbi:MAG: hypothetical protein NTW27_06030 [Deltaproteobacteria bacterium]|nr:hypothetical protein [Deltaproteobacteria bacterium]
MSRLESPTSNIGDRSRAKSFSQGNLPVERQDVDFFSASRFTVNIESTYRVSRLCLSRGLVAAFVILVALLVLPEVSEGSAYDFLRLTTRESVFAVDPDLMIRSIDETASDRLWTLGRGWGFRPFFFRSRVADLYDRIDFLYPFGCREESRFRRKLRLVPFFESRWSKLPPFEGFSRCLTLYKGRSDLGQNYWGFFPFYGYTHRRFGVDHNFFLLFPLYYESTDDGDRTFRLLWPLITYSSGPSRASLKVWPFYGRDAIRNDYFSSFVLWPFFQRTLKYPGTEQASLYSAMPFPVFVRQEDSYSSSTHILWPFMTFYRHYRSGHWRFSFRPFLTYGTGGGIEELSFLFFYSSKEDHRQATASKDSEGYISVAGDEVVTERSFLKMSSIKKRFRKGCLVYARYRFWPFAEYIWDVKRGSRLKVPEIIPLNDQWWDLNLGRLLRFVDFRDTPITTELSTLFGLRQTTAIKQIPNITCPPNPGDDDWAELISGSFGRRSNRPED